MYLKVYFKMTFLEAAKKILIKFENKPMSADNIWLEICRENLSSEIRYKDTRPVDSLFYMLRKSSINSNLKTQYKKKYFESIDSNPLKFRLINPNENEVIKDDIETDDDFKIKRFGNFNKSNFKASQSQEEREYEDFSKNPFMQAICVLGGSGAGKSTTIENILESEGHDFEFIIPSASTTLLLSQFSPNKSILVPSKLGKMITNAYDNPKQLFTAVFDECHKSNVIEMINDEILQAISIKRNNGKRFITLDDDTAELYPNSEKYRGNILIPDNLGFIFISSKPDVILHNDDFFSRIDIVMLKPYTEENLTNINQLKLKVLSEEEKNSLKSNND